jgi:hypothetical protein
MTDLKKLAGQKYRVVDDGTDDSNRAERVWCYEIRGKYGKIYPQGWNGDLAVCTYGWRVGSKIAASGFPQISGPPGCGEAVFRFPPGDLDRVAAIIKAGRRRQANPERRARLAETLAKARSRIQPRASVPVWDCQEASSQAGIASDMPTKPAGGIAPVQVQDSPPALG